MYIRGIKNQNIISLKHKILIPKSLLYRLVEIAESKSNLTLPEI